VTYLNNFMDNNAIPAGVVVAKGQVNEDDWNLFKRQWSEKYSGVDNAGKTGYVRGSDLDFVKTGLSLKDMDFENVKRSNREDIMIMFGISKPMMAIFDDINRASAVDRRTAVRQVHHQAVAAPPDPQALQEGRQVVRGGLPGRIDQPRPRGRRNQVPAPREGRQQVADRQRSPPG
jgi:hypothetical protein